MLPESKSQTGTITQRFFTKKVIVEDPRRLRVGTHFQ